MMGHWSIDYGQWAASVSNKLFTINQFAMSFIKKNILVIAGVAAGALAGFLYWNFIGCSSGSCAITSRPVNSSVYGALMGGLLFSLFTKDKKKANDVQGND